MQQILMTRDERQIRIGELYIRKYDPNKEPKILIGIWDGSCTQLDLEQIKALRKAVNDILLEMVFKTTTCMK